MTERQAKLCHPITLILIRKMRDGSGYEKVVCYDTTNGNHDFTVGHISKEIEQADYIYRNYGGKLGCDVIKGRPTETSVGWIPLRV